MIWYTARFNDAQDLLDLGTVKKKKKLTGLGNLIINIFF